MSTNNNTIKYVDNTEILNEKRRFNAFKLLDEITEKGITQDISDKNHYAVMSSKTGTYYEVSFLNSGKWCSCMDFSMFGHLENFKCKHIFSVEILKEQKKTIQKGVLKID